MENQALREVAGQINATAQLAVQALKAVALRELELYRVEANGAVAMLIKVNDGMDLSEDLLNQMSKLFKMPVCVLPKSMTLEALQSEQLESAGWTRRLVVAP